MKDELPGSTNNITILKFQTQAKINVDLYRLLIVDGLAVDSWRLKFHVADPFNVLYLNGI